MPPPHRCVSMADLRITVDDRVLEAGWVEGAPTTRRAIEAALPLAGAAARWGDELYVEVPVDVGPEDTVAEVPVGAVAYWPAGNALCLFWGPTPASTGETPRAASPVTVVAQVADVGPLADLDGGADIRVEAA